MPGSLWTGYLQAEQRAQQEEELADEKKREKLEESLNQLRLSQLTREIKRTAEEWKIQKETRARLNQALENLRTRGVDVDALIAGYKAPKVTGPKIGTMPWAKGWGINPQTGEWEYTAPEEKKTGAKEATVSQVASAMDILYPKSMEYEEAGLVETTPDSLWAGLISAPRTAAEQPFFTGKQKLVSALGGPTLPGPKVPTVPTEEGIPRNRQELKDLAKAQGIKKIKDRAGLKADLPWVTDEDIDWLESQL